MVSGERGMWCNVICCCCSFSYCATVCRLCYRVRYKSRKAVQEAVTLIYMRGDGDSGKDMAGKPCPQWVHSQLWQTFDTAPPPPQRRDINKRVSDHIKLSVNLDRRGQRPHLGYWKRWCLRMKLPPSAARDTHVKLYLQILDPVTAFREQGQRWERWKTGVFPFRDVKSKRC